MIQRAEVEMIRTTAHFKQIFEIVKLATILTVGDNEVTTVKQYYHS
jgi:hypothetical protein